VVINDEAHHVYGEKRGKKGEDAEYIKWSKILDRLGQAARVSLVMDFSATPWYGSGSPKPEGTLFEWLVSDFSVYDAFESGLVKVVRLPDPDEHGRVYLDLWDLVKGARTKEEYLRACKGAIASIYSSWKKDHDEWTSSFAFARGPAPVLLCVTDSAQSAAWLFEHLTRDYPLLRNPDDEARTRWVTIPIDSKVVDADKGNEAVLREMVNTVGSKGKPGEHVRAIVSVNMLSEGWDVKRVTHILGLRAFGSPLLTEQIIGRGLRRTNYDVLNQPLVERPEGSEETVWTPSAFRSSASRSRNASDPRLGTGAGSRYGSKPTQRRRSIACRCRTCARGRWVSRSRWRSSSGSRTCRRSASTPRRRLRTFGCGPSWAVRPRS
jgi:type III restriction enzyme